MAGTDRKRGVDGAVEGAPAVILVRPQLGENIGMVARAMLNCGMTDLRLVKPRDGWPSTHAIRASSGATVVLDQVRLFDTTAEAVADLQKVYATTARSRDMTKNVVTPRRAAVEIRAASASDIRCGLMFGPEAKGLHNDDIVLADTILQVPLNPGFSSLNLAQAVLLVAFQWYSFDDETPEIQGVVPKNRVPVPKRKLIDFFEHLEAELDESGFLHNIEKRPSMVRNLRNMFQRADLTDQEVRTLRGVIVSLVGMRRERKS